MEGLSGPVAARYEFYPKLKYSVSIEKNWRFIIAESSCL